jgi:soluble lytic murein transglycosylase-like protein
MHRASSRYLTGAATLLALAVALFAAAASQLDAAASAGHRAAGPAARLLAANPHGATTLPVEVAAAPVAEGSAASGNELRPTAAGEDLSLARDRIAKGTLGPGREVDQWAIHLASERGGSEAALRRFSVYRALIQETLIRYDLPLDLAFIPWVESEWRNDTASVAGADGMWQFMPATARGYGLEVSYYVDERRDPVRATDAAARHLVDLFRETADWHTTLAAYNAGLGRARGRGSFWRRRPSLPAETRAYVPRVLAAARVGRAPKQWGLNPPTAAPLRFREIWVAGGVSLASTASSIGVPAQALRELNPHLIRGMTPPGRRWPVRVPSTVNTATPAYRILP